MKPKYLSRTTAVSLMLALPAGADVIYSNLKDIAIPTNFTGVYLDVDTGNWNTNINAPQSGWDVNPFFGGSSLWNSPGFQPVRSGTGEMDSVLNLAAGTTVGVGSVFSTFVQGPGGQNPGGPGYGYSESHMGNGVGQFVSGSEGYIGFRMTDGDYGWMRVVLTNNTGGALIKEWAYENSGASIGVANIKRNGSTVTLDSVTGSFTVSSAIIDSSGTTNLEKIASGTATLTGTNTYTGTTSVTAGTLVIASGGSTHASSAVTVSNSGSALVVNGTVNGTLLANVSTTISGTGTVSGAATVNGNLNPGDNGTGLLTFGSSLTMADTTLTTVEINGMLLGIDYDAVNAAGALTYDGALALAMGATFGTGTYTFNLFDFGSQTGSLDSVTLSGLYTGSLVNNGFGVWQAVTNSGTEIWAFTQSTGNLSLVVVPEPNVAALLGGIGLLFLLRRRR